MSNNIARKTLVALALVGLLSTASVDAATRGGKSKKEEVRYPDATRVAPEAKVSPKMGKQVQKLIDTFNKDEYEAAKPLAEEILASDKSNNYDKALAALLASQTAYNLDDVEAAKTYARQAVDLNALDNNNHYSAMQFLAQMQLQNDENEEGLKTLDRYLSETKSQKPEDLILKGNALYQMERYQEAIPVIKQAVEASPEPNTSWVQLLMACYLETDQGVQAMQLAEQIAAKTPDDKKAQLNLANVYLQADKYDEAAAVLEKLRASGQLTDERDYRQLYITYANMDGKEKETIAVIKEGIDKGVLKPDHQTYLALAQASYYSDQIPEAIAAWEKAAPMAPNGDTYLNLARVYWQEGRIPDAKRAAQAALDKGLKKPEDARKILSLK
ncbi:hypothetical protein CSC70_02030 [Pseudoxanthomonas kalamensis DSM 18571]|uniref:heme biosynthesis protein HemY n=1 Tax=Pseudoxanthomonas kalamensis TaxID=289483 RepID=UPI001391FAC8|nr:hypothetical protein CSC70_02030 [Pseudoxanthomonas kalamensis DSM 18571]